MVIDKYEVSSEVVTMPEGAQILSVHVEGGYPYIWALVDPTAQREERHFKLIATRQPFDPDGLTYVGTFHDTGVTLHLFEVSQLPALPPLKTRLVAYTDPADIHTTTDSHGFEIQSVNAVLRVREEVSE